MGSQRVGLNWVTEMNCCPLQPSKERGQNISLKIAMYPKFILIKFYQSFRYKTIKQSVQFSHSVMSDSLRSPGLQHARPPCPSPTPRVHPNPCLSSWWCHPTISSSVVPFSSFRQSFPVSGSFQMSQLFKWGGQSIGVSTLVLPVNTQDWSPLG